jgi:hypothetical protein
VEEVPVNLLTQPAEVITEQIQKFHLLQLRLAEVLAALEGGFLQILMEIMEDLVVVEVGLRQEAKIPQGQVAQQHLDKVITEDLKWLQRRPLWEEVVLVQLVDLRTALEVVMVEMDLHILGLLMLVVVVAVLVL